MFDWIANLWAWLRCAPGGTPQPPGVEPALARPIERVLLSEGVAQTLFSDFSDHRQTERGDEEIGWILLGYWMDGQPIAVAALPAGAARDAGAAHVQFDSEAQSLACRILRQCDKRLQVIGVVHTHPGSLRRPSDGDLRGDILWVRHLRAGIGVFAIGTADARSGESAAHHQQLACPLLFSWYALGVGDRDYRTLPVTKTPGADLATSLRPVWTTIEAFADPINRLCRQLARVQFDVLAEDLEATLVVRIPLAEPNQELRLLLNLDQARYYWDNAGELVAIDPDEPQLDRAVYLILAELCPSLSEAPSSTQESH